MKDKRLPLQSQLLVLPILLLILLIGIAPFTGAFRDSFYHDNYGEQSFAGLENYKIILGDAAFPYSLNITVLWAFLNVSLCIVFSFLLALRLMNTKSSFLHRMLLIPWGIPVYIAIPLWRAFLHGNGGDSVITKLTGLHINLMIDPIAGFLGALLVSLWLSIPITTFVFAGHMRKVSHSVIEAAHLDGAGNGEIARHIYIPEIKDSLLAMAVLNFIKAFKEFTLVFMLTSGGPPLLSGITDRHIVGATTTLGVFLYEVFLQNSDWGINAAYALIMAVLVLFIMSLWILIRKQKSLRIFLIFSALVLIPGGKPVLWIMAIGYMVLVLLNKKQLMRILVLLHLGVTVFLVVTEGYLAGFHPGILLPLLTLLIQKKQERNSSRQFHMPLKNWKIQGPALTTASGLIMGLFIVLTIIILYMLLWMSFSRISSCFIDSFVPPLSTTENFRIIFAEEGILRYFINTFVVAGITAGLLPFLVFPGAVYLNKAGSKTTLTFLAFIQIVGIAGGMHSLIPLYRIFRAFSLIDNYLPLILIYLYHSIPMALFVLTAYLKTIPTSFRDLAKLEGMGEHAYAFRILLPLSLPPLLTVVMIAFVSGWNGFQAPLLFLNSEEKYTISLKLFSYVGNLASGSPVWNLFAAASVANTLFIGTLFMRFRSPMTTSPLSESETD
ncbi:ABC transporter permease subunit [Oceanispirochaeta crateris]|uniref:ABC transporter permease subunit n=1 Tax=Oceanispirochaeta crateris TaxID=2518645 RepID=A0A5C1QQQ1_9SPIO|nr:ABC transporter permease subunit [Oceanispirochaeta crateris]QEN08944.1 ABC transporter permease subunit [Oceanispirochaeta crateris]